MSAALLPEAVTGLDPLVITSPVIRSGTTLLQRLLCSAREALIYGELCGQDLDFLLQLHQVKTQLYTSKSAVLADDLRRVLAGEVNDWRPDLMPPTEAYLAALGAGAFSGLAYCREYARSVGRPVWGFKYPGWPPHRVQLLRRTMPKARFLCIHRRLPDTVRSAKAQGEVQTEEQLRVFCETWAVNLQFALGQAGGPSFLLLRYEDLVHAPAETLGRIAAFTGLESIDPAVLEHRINSHTGRYEPPAELAPEEERVVRSTMDAFHAKP